MQTLRSALRRPPASLVTRMDRAAASQRNQRPSSKGASCGRAPSPTAERSARARRQIPGGPENNAGSGTISRCRRSCSPRSVTLKGKSIDTSAVRFGVRPQIASGRVRLNPLPSTPSKAFYFPAPRLILKLRPHQACPRFVWKGCADEIPDPSNEVNEGHHNQHHNQSVFDRSSPP